MGSFGGNIVWCTGSVTYQARGCCCCSNKTQFIRQRQILSTFGSLRKRYFFLNLLGILLNLMPLPCLVTDLYTEEEKSAAKITSKKFTQQDQLGCDISTATKNDIYVFEH